MSEKTSGVPGPMADLVTSARLWPLCCHPFLLTSLCPSPHRSLDVTGQNPLDPRGLHSRPRDSCCLWTASPPGAWAPVTMSLQVRSTTGGLLLACYRVGDLPWTLLWVTLCLGGGCAFPALPSSPRAGTGPPCSVACLGGSRAHRGLECCGGLAWLRLHSLRQRGLAPQGPMLFCGQERVDGQGPAGRGPWDCGRLVSLADRAGAGARTLVSPLGSEDRGPGLALPLGNLLCVL